MSQEYHADLVHDQQLAQRLQSTPKEPTRIVNLRRRLQRMQQTKQKMQQSAVGVGKSPDNRQLSALQNEWQVKWELDMYEKHGIVIRHSGTKLIATNVEAHSEGSGGGSDPVSGGHQRPIPLPLPTAGSLSVPTGGLHSPSGSSVGSDFGTDTSDQGAQPPLPMILPTTPNSTTTRGQPTSLFMHSRGAPATPHTATTISSGNVSLGSVSVGGTSCSHSNTNTNSSVCATPQPTLAGPKTSPPAGYHPNNNPTTHTLNSSPVAQGLPHPTPHNTLPIPHQAQHAQLQQQQARTGSTAPHTHHQQAPFVPHGVTPTAAAGGGSGSAVVPSSGVLQSSQLDSVPFYAEPPGGMPTLDPLPDVGAALPVEVSRALAFPTPKEYGEREPTRIVNLRRRLQRMVHTRERLAEVYKSDGSAKVPDNRQIKALTSESHVVWEILQWEKYNIIYPGRKEQRWIPSGSLPPIETPSISTTSPHSKEPPGNISMCEVADPSHRLGRLAPTPASTAAPLAHPTPLAATAGGSTATTTPNVPTTSATTGILNPAVSPGGRPQHGNLNLIAQPHQWPHHQNAAEFSPAPGGSITPEPISPPSSEKQPFFNVHNVGTVATSSPTLSDGHGHHQQQQCSVEEANKAALQPNGAQPLIVSPVPGALQAILLHQPVSQQPKAPFSQLNLPSLSVGGEAAAPHHGAGSTTGLTYTETSPGPSPSCEDEDDDDYNFDFFPHSLLHQLVSEERNTTFGNVSLRDMPLVHLIDDAPAGSNKKQNNGTTAVQPLPQQQHAVPHTPQQQQQAQAPTVNTQNNPLLQVESESPPVSPRSGRKLTPSALEVHDRVQTMANGDSPQRPGAGRNDWESFLDSKFGSNENVQQSANSSATPNQSLQNAQTIDANSNVITGRSRSVTPQPNLSSPLLSSAEMSPRNKRRANSDKPRSPNESPDNQTLHQFVHNVINPGSSSISSNLSVGSSAMSTSDYGGSDIQYFEHSWTIWTNNTFDVDDNAFIPITTFTTVQQFRDEWDKLHVAEKLSTDKGCIRVFRSGTTPTVDAALHASSNGGRWVSNHIPPRLADNARLELIYSLCNEYYDTAVGVSCTHKSIELWTDGVLSYMPPDQLEQAIRDALRESFRLFADVKFDFKPHDIDQYIKFVQECKTEKVNNWLSITPTVDWGCDSSNTPQSGRSPSNSCLLLGVGSLSATPVSGRSPSNSGLLSLGVATPTYAGTPLSGRSPSNSTYSSLLQLPGTAAVPTNAAVSTGGVVEGQTPSEVSRRSSFQSEYEEPEGTLFSMLSGIAHGKKLQERLSFHSNGSTDSKSSNQHGHASGGLLTNNGSSPTSPQTAPTSSNTPQTTPTITTQTENNQISLSIPTLGV